ncbi:MAG: hypothetical protein AAFQ82_06205, partial [Myxococcota bacterium]
MAAAIVEIDQRDTAIEFANFPLFDFSVSGVLRFDLLALFVGFAGKIFGAWSVATLGSGILIACSSSDAP